MKLLINAESLVRPLTGIGQYTRSLVGYFDRAPQVEAVHCFAGHRLRSARSAIDRLDRAEARGGAFAERFMAVMHGIASRTLLPYRTHKRAGDEAFRHAVRRLPANTIYHEPNYVLKPFDGPSVVTIHDLSIIRFPEHHPKARVDYIGKNMYRSVHASARVITDSELVRQEVIDHFGVSPEKVVSIHLGVDSMFRPVDRAAAQTVLARHGLQYGEYTLSVSTLEPRKNLESLLVAFEKLDSTLRKRYPLVVVGARGWHSEALERALDRLVIRGEAKRLGYVGRDELPVLFGACRLFVFPSLYEGFGLPVLEAMACGAPVLTSSGTSMAEFAGDAAAFCDPGNVESINSGMRTLMEDEERLLQLSGLALNASRKLTWDRCALEHLALYDSVLNARK